jgi:hypothetical protein
VGSSLSGSLARAIRSVPPFFAARLSALCVAVGVSDLIELHPARTTAPARRTAVRRANVRLLGINASLV